MAEFLKQPKEKPISAFSCMGGPISFVARQRAFDACLEMGIDRASAYECVSGMAEQLERDKPYEAMAAGMRHLDLTGAYRAMAVLLAAAQDADTASPGKSD